MSNELWIASKEDSKQKYTMMSASIDSEEELSYDSPREPDKSTSLGSIGSGPKETMSPIIPPAEILKRKLGSNEVFAFNSHNFGNMNIVCGLTLLTRNSIDEGNT